MQKIGDVTNTADEKGEFSNGNIAAGKPATVLAADYLNTVQRELVSIVEDVGKQKLDPNNHKQISAILNGIKNDVSGKINASAIVQITGTSTTAVMSQKAVTDELGKKQIAGSYVTTDSLTNSLKNKIDASAIVQTSGTSTTTVMSQDATTKAINAVDLTKGGIISGTVNITTNDAYGFNLKSAGITDANRIAFYHGAIWSGWIGVSSGNIVINNTKTSTYLSVADGFAFINGIRVVTATDYPVGIPQPWPTDTPPTGWLKCNGATFNKTTYPELAKAYPSGVLPDLRGQFIRGWDDGRGVDVGRIILTGQNDTFKSHAHSYTSKKAIGGTTDGGDPNSVGNVSALTSTVGDVETRPKNVAFNYIVRAL